MSYRWLAGIGLIVAYASSEALVGHMEHASATSVPLWSIYGLLSASMLAAAYYLKKTSRTAIMEAAWFVIAAILLVRTANSVVAIYQFSTEIVEAAAEEETSADALEI
jgi:hypothetical protein